MFLRALFEMLGVFRTVSTSVTSFKKKKRLEMAATKTGPPKRLNLTSEIQ